MKRDAMFSSPITTAATSRSLGSARMALIGERTALAQFSGSGPKSVASKKPYAHSVYTDPKNKFVYSCDLGSDSVWIFKFDPVHGTLVPSDPPAAKVPPGSGPRHLAFSPDGKLVYAVNEMGLSVTVFARDVGERRIFPLSRTVPTLLPGMQTKGCHHGRNLLSSFRQMALRFEPRDRCNFGLYGCFRSNG